MVNFMLREARGLICVALTRERADEMDLPPQAEQNTEGQQTAFTVTVDATPRFGVTTGVSASDRAATIRVAADPSTTARDLRRPGHISPLRARDGGVLRRVGHTEAAVDLARLSGHWPAGVICEIMNEDGSMAKRPELERFATRHGLTFVTIAQLVAYRLQTERLVHRVAEARLPTRVRGVADRRLPQRCRCARARGAGTWRRGGGEEVLVRMHSTVPDRRRVPLEAVRLRLATRPGDGAD